MSPDNKPRGEIYFEYMVRGLFVRVTAIEAATGVEATIVGKADLSQIELERLALAKLEFVKSKQDKPRDTPGKGVLV